MFRNYFKIAWRKLWKHKLFSIINIISLAVGFSASFVIGLMVYYDLTFDKFHPDSELIYRVTSNFITSDSERSNRGIPIPYINEARNSISGIEFSSGIHVANLQKVVEETTKKTFKNPEYVVFIEPEYFQIFKYNWLAGNPEIALNAPNQVVLTNKRAQKYFPSLQPNEIIGKSLAYNDSIQTTVSGIVANFEERSDLIFEEFLSLETAKKTSNGNSIFDPQWDNTSSGSQLFIKVSSPSVTSFIKEKMDALAVEHRSEWAITYNQSQSFNLQPLSDLHFNTEVGTFDFGERPADKSVMFGLGLLPYFYSYWE